MSLQRVKELLAAWEAGATREDELAELRRLLLDVIEAAELPSDDVLKTEADRVRYPISHDHTDMVSVATRAYIAGAKRKGRGRTP